MNTDKDGQAQVALDLRDVFSKVPLASLIHLRENRHRLTRGVYVAPNGRKCLMALLTETLPEGARIETKKDLTRYFGVAHGQPDSPDYVPAKDSLEYAPAKWLVRLVDCQAVPDRYGKLRFLDWGFMLAVLDEVIAERQSIESESRDVEQRALARVTRRRKPGDAPCNRSGHSPQLV
jgi:hypothetical protein